MVAGNRNQRENGREVAATEGVWRFVPGDGTDQRTTEPVRGVALSNDGARLAVAEGDYSEGMRSRDLPPQAVSVFDAHTGAELLRNPRFPALPNRVEFLPGTRTLIVTTHAHNLHVYDEQAGWRHLEGADTESIWGGRRPSHNGVVRAAVVDSSGRYLLSVSGVAQDDPDRELYPRSNELRVWDLRAPADPDLQDYRLTDLPEGLFDATLAPGGHWLVLASWRRVVLRQWLPPGE